MTRVTPYYDTDGITIYHGDCMEIAEAIPQCDIIVADPPFFMPAQHYASRSDWARSWGDTAILSRWWAHSLDVLGLRLKGTGSAFVFCDDESYSVFYPPTFNRFPAISALIWNKGRIGMGSPWRHAHEFILHARRADAKWRGSGGETDVLAFAPTSSARRFHPVNKPVSLLGKLISVSTDHGDIVFDPFMGGGSTLAAARDLGRRAIGIEIEERYCEVAANRLSQVTLNL